MVGLVPRQSRVQAIVSVDARGEVGAHGVALCRVKLLQRSLEVLHMVIVSLLIATFKRVELLLSVPKVNVSLALNLDSDCLGAFEPRLLRLSSCVFDPTRFF